MAEPDPVEPALALDSRLRSQKRVLHQEPHGSGAKNQKRVLHVLQFSFPPILSVLRIRMDQ